MIAALLAALCGSAGTAAKAAAGDGMRLTTVHLAAPGATTRLRSPFAFQMVGLRWRGSGVLQLRSRRSGGSWSRWAAVKSEEPAWTDTARYVQIRRVGGRPVRALAVTFIAVPPMHMPRQAGMVAHAAAMPPIITRSGWGANESLRRAPPEIAPALRMVFVHHTDTTNSYSCSSSAQIVRGIYAYHVLSLGWNDIGYNFLIDRCGRIFEGRYGGMTRPVVGAQTGGFNWESAGIAMIGTFNTVRPTGAALWSLERLISWRLDVAHVNPLSGSIMTSSGNNPKYPAGHRLWLRNVSGHRDGYPTACPGNALYALLPAVARAAAAIGLPKIYHPMINAPIRRIGPGTASPITFHAAFSHKTSWELQVKGPLGETAGVRRGYGSTLAWTWAGHAANLPPGPYHWTLTAPGARPVSMTLGSLRGWIEGGAPVAYSATTTGGDLESLLAIDRNTLDVAGSPPDLETTNHVRVTQPQWLAAREVGVRFTAATAVRNAVVQVWNYTANAWATVGTCSADANQPCVVERALDVPSKGRWDAGEQMVEMRARYLFQTPTRVDEAHTLMID